MSTGKQTLLTRIKAALLMFAVLNVTVAPCAMAFDGGRHCPNCPPEREQEMAAHHGHGDSAHAHHSGDQHGHGDDHEATEATLSDCESLKAQCGDLDDSNVGFRLGQSDVDPQQPLAAAPVPVAAVPVPRVLVPLATGPPPCLSRGSPRLHALHCVYRD